MVKHQNIYIAQKYTTVLQNHSWAVLHDTRIQLHCLTWHNNAAGLCYKTQTYNETLLQDIKFCYIIKDTRRYQDTKIQLDCVAGQLGCFTKHKNIHCILQLHCFIRHKSTAGLISEYSWTVRRHQTGLYYIKLSFNE